MKMYIYTDTYCFTYSLLHHYIILITYIDMTVYMQNLQRNADPPIKGSAVGTNERPRRRPTRLLSYNTQVSTR